MKLVLAGILSASAVTALGSGAAPVQQPTRPGEISPANVWIQNRAPSDAVPVMLVDTTGQSVRVQVTGMAPVPSIEQPVGTRAVRQAWEYMQVRVTANQDAAAILNQAGAEGWEAVNATAGTGATAVLLKRPR